jgi:hypothetical protein
MHGIALILLIAAALWIFSTGWLVFALIPAIGIGWMVATDPGDMVDQVFGGFFLIAIIAFAAVGLKSLLSAF